MQQEGAVTREAIIKQCIKLAALELQCHVYSPLMNIYEYAHKVASSGDF